MPTNGSAEHFVLALKESLQRLESLHSLSTEETEWVNKLMQHIRTKIAELDRE